jgi:tripartite-type tricarboxylate transporter receptor subunit TctC
VVAVSAGSRYRTVKDLIDDMKANPGKLTFGHAGIGSQTHLAAENFLNAAGADAVAVPYKGEGPALAGLITGDVNFAVTNVAATLPHINSGRVRALGVTSKTEAPQLPGVPPVAKTLQGFENTGWFGIVAPTGTPRPIIDKVYRDTRKALEASDLKGRLYVQGLAPVGNTPEEMGKAMKEESRLWARVVRERNIKVR